MRFGLRWVFFCFELLRCGVGAIFVFWCCGWLLSVVICVAFAVIVSGYGVMITLLSLG